MFGGEGEEAEKIDVVAKIMIFLGICASCLILSGVKVVYGRYSIQCSSLWGFKIDARAAWLIQVITYFLISRFLFSAMTNLK